jgi:hypothetical protein
MRHDMLHVIVEGPCVAAECSRLSYRILQNRLRNSYRAAKHFTLDEENEVCDEYCRTVLPMRHRRVGYDCKMFSPHYSPFVRYLGAQAGRPWNDVYSEISARLRSSAAVTPWVSDCASWLVHINTYRDTDNRVRDANFAGRRHKCDFVGDLYVEPETGILRAGTRPNKQSDR